MKLARRTRGVVAWAAKTLRRRVTPRAFDAWLFAVAGWAAITVGVAPENWRAWVVSFGLLLWAHAALIFVALKRTLTSRPPQ